MNQRVLVELLLIDIRFKAIMAQNNSDTLKEKILAQKRIPENSGTLPVLSDRHRTFRESNSRTIFHVSCEINGSWVFSTLIHSLSGFGTCLCTL